MRGRYHHPSTNNWSRTVPEREVAGVGGLDPFIFLGYSGQFQDPIGSYEADSIQRPRTVSQKYDSGKLFTIQVPGGYKIPGVKFTWYLLGYPSVCAVEGWPWFVYHAFACSLTGVFYKWSFGPGRSCCSGSTNQDNVGWFIASPRELFKVVRRSVPHLEFCWHWQLKCDPSHA